METESNNNERAMKENLLSAIADGGVEMRPRWHFVAQTVMYTVGGVFLVLGVFYTASLVVLSLRRSGALHMPSFGTFGWYEFFYALPWVFILISVVGLLLLESLLRHFSFAYRQPVLYSFLGILFVAWCGVVIIDRIEMHKAIREFSDQHGLFPITTFYRGIDDHRRYLQGGVIQNGDREVLVSEENGVHARIIFDTNTQFPEGRAFATSDMIVIFGDSEGDTIHARGVRLLAQ